MSPKFIFTCDVCGGGFQFGQHVYGGKYIPKYQITVCNGCYSSNGDGWAPKFWPAVTRRLTERGLPIPARNAKGWLPRD